MLEEERRVSSVNLEEETKRFIDDLIEKFNQEWKTGYTYTADNLEKFESADCTHLEDLQITKDSLLYVQALVKMAIRHLSPSDFPTLFKDETIAYDEVTDWNDSGGLCIYTSVLLYYLLKEEGYGKNQLKYVQGYYTHQTQTQIAQLFYKDITGLHSFVTWKGYVLDASILQLEDYYGTDQNNLFTIGEFADGTQYYGWVEEKTTPYKYAKRMAKKQGLSLDDWIQYHKRKEKEFVGFLKQQNGDL